MLRLKTGPWQPLAHWHGPPRRSYSGSGHPSVAGLAAGWPEPQRLHPAAVADPVHDSPAPVARQLLTGNMDQLCCHHSDHVAAAAMQTIT